MTYLAIELNDAGVIACADPAVVEAELEESPGYALLQDGRVLVGGDAARRCRLTPLYAQNRFWHELGPARLPWSTPDVTTCADLAHAHLRQLVGPAADAVAGMLVAVPPGYSREQLGLLAGVAGETGVPLRGFVDLGLAACAARASAPHVLHLDVSLHQAVVTVVEHARAEGALRRARYELLPGCGLLAIQQSLIEFVATAFVRATRFDPLHQASTEQGLFDDLPRWLARLDAAETTEAQVTLGAKTHRAELSREALVAAVQHHVSELVRLVQASRPAGLAVRLDLSHRAAVVPGLAAALGSLRDCNVVRLDRGAVVRGILAHADAIVRPRDGLALVHRLPLGAPEEPAPPVTGLERVPPLQVPTHVLYRGEAWAITERPLELGSSPGAGQRALQLPAGTPGLSRSHCTLLRDGGAALVEDRSTYGTFLNAERVAGRVALRVGDLLRLGAPGITLELIRVNTDDGAP